jgi:hypothetical protein
VYDVCKVCVCVCVCVCVRLCVCVCSRARVWTRLKVDEVLGLRV